MELDRGQQPVLRQSSSCSARVIFLLLWIHLNTCVSLRFQWVGMSARLAESRTCLPFLESPVRISGMHVDHSQSSPEPSPIRGVIRSRIKGRARRKVTPCGGICRCRRNPLWPTSVIVYLLIYLLVPFVHNWGVRSPSIRSHR